MDPLKPLRKVRTREQVAYRNESGQKMCTSCKEWLPVSLFGSHPKTTDGLRGECSPCEKTSGEMRRYGAKTEDVLEAQGGACLICGTDDPGSYRWQMDHDHSCCPGSSTCGKCIRGVLCHLCNLGLGSFKDSVETLYAAIQYLSSRSPLDIPLSDHYAGDNTDEKEKE